MLTLTRIQNVAVGLKIISIDLKARRLILTLKNGCDFQRSGIILYNAHAELCDYMAKNCPVELQCVHQPTDMQQQ